MDHSGQLPVVQDNVKNKSWTQKSVCINNNNLWWPVVLYLQGVQCIQCMWWVYSNVYHTPHSSTPPPPILPDPLWASSASWMTVSMWRSSLRWKGSRLLGYCASFTKLGFHPHFTVSANGWDCEWKLLKQCAVLYCQISGLQQWLDAALGDLASLWKESQQPSWSHEMKRKC